MSSKENKEDRRDPTSFLPEEEMSYEIKKKKKKKKKKQEDPFKDIEENTVAREPDVTALDPDMGLSLDPEVTIKVENIEVELDFNDFAQFNDDGSMDGNEDSQPEPAVRTIEDENREAVLLTFQSVINDKLLYGEADESEQPKAYMCKICHLVFKSPKTLEAHQKRKHKFFRRTFKHNCSHCPMAYEAKNSLDAHIRRKHGPNAKEDDKLEKACDICALVFKGTSRLRMHMRRKHGSFAESFKYQCDDCGLTYDKYSSLFVHIKRKHMVQPKKPVNEWFTCPFCAKIFSRRETYTRHIQRKHRVSDDENCDSNIKPKVEQKSNERTGEVTCPHCSLAFSSVNYLKWHMRRKHNACIDDFRLKCKICNLSYSRIESLKRHVRRKHDKGTFCEVCNKNFANRHNYLNHSHGREAKECNVCGLIFAHQGSLVRHLRCIHKIDSPKTVFCGVCNAGFYDKRQLKPHYMRVHLQASYTCMFCSKSFRSKESYRRHLMVKHPDDNKLEDGPTHKCEKCPETFKDEFELCKHINIVHSGTELNIKKEDDDSLQSFKCTKCTDEFSSWEQLKSHFEGVHYNNAETQCQVCGAMMTRLELVKHMKTHEEVEVQCKFCEFKTKNRVSMTQHLLRHKNAATLHCDFNGCKYKTFYDDAMEKHKKKHEEIGVKLQCASCPFQTMNKYILKYHEEAHSTGKKRYACDQCNYATILPANLVQHKYKHSAEKRFKCEVCPFATKYNTSLRFHVRKKHCDLPTFS